MDKLNDLVNNSVIDNAVDVETVEVRLAYVKPHLEELGDLRTLTLGITQGINESGPFSPNHNP